MHRDNLLVWLSCDGIAVVSLLLVPCRFVSWDCIAAASRLYRCSVKCPLKFCIWVLDKDIQLAVYQLKHLYHFHITITDSSSEPVLEPSPPARVRSAWPWSRRRGSPPLHTSCRRTPRRFGRSGLGNLLRHTETKLKCSLIMSDKRDIVVCAMFDVE